MQTDAVDFFYEKDNRHSSNSNKIIFMARCQVTSGTDQWGFAVIHKTSNLKVQRSHILVFSVHFMQLKVIYNHNPEAVGSLVVTHLSLSLTMCKLC